MVWTFFFFQLFMHIYVDFSKATLLDLLAKKKLNCKHRFVLHLQVLTFFFLSAFHSFLKFNVAFFSATKRIAVNFLDEELGNAMVDGFILKDNVSKHFETRVKNFNKPHNKTSYFLLQYLHKLNFHANNFLFLLYRDLHTNFLR